MRKVGLWIVSLFMCISSLQAQETPTDPYASERAKIREIKLSSEYYYADVSSEHEEDIETMARNMILLIIQEEEPECKVDLTAFLQDSCRYIRMKRAGIPRAFVYVSREAVAVKIFGKLPESSSRQEAVSQDTGVKQDTIIDVPSQPDTPVETIPADTTVVVDDSTRISQVKQDAVQHVPSPVPVVKRDTLIQKDTLKVTVVDTLKVVVRDTNRIVVQDTNRVVVRDTNRVIVRDTTHVTITDTIRKQYEIRTTGNDRLDEIVRMKTIQEVEKWFIAEKRAGRMMFGKLETVVRPENCYLLIFNKEGRVVAVLDKGEASRRNLTTGKTGDHQNHYPKHGVIWFTLH